MPKQKTHKGASKRFRVSANGKVTRKSAFAGHLMSTKSGNRCRSLRRVVGLSPAMEKKMLLALKSQPLSVQDACFSVYSYRSRRMRPITDA